MKMELPAASGMRWRLQRRPGISIWVGIASRVIAVMVALLLSGVIIELSGLSALALAKRAVESTLGSAYGLEQAAVLGDLHQTEEKGHGADQADGQLHRGAGRSQNAVPGQLLHATVPGREEDRDQDDRYEEAVEHGSILTIPTLHLKCNLQCLETGRVRIA